MQEAHDRGGRVASAPAPRPAPALSACRNARPRAEEIIELLGLAGKRHRLSRNLSHGDQKLLDIGLALALEPKVLLLDEPTAGMGPDERWRMIDKVQRSVGGRRR